MLRVRMMEIWIERQRNGSRDIGMNEETEKIVVDVDGAVATGSGRRRKKEKESFRLTDRDYDILSFLLDQKFASLEQLYFRFFDGRVKVTDPLPKNLFVTRQRLSILRRADFIATQRVFSEAKSLYLLSPKGFQLLRSKRPHDAYAAPPRDVDFRNYEHDTKVNDCRIAIERTGKLMKWISERRLRKEGFESQFSDYQLPEEIVPDGIFVSSKGERIAFEIESTPRKKSRYEDKRSSFSDVMYGKSPLLHRVFWVGATARIVSDLKEVVDGDKRFIVESYSHFLSKLWPKGTPEKVSP
jgi:hypothetical protein